ncbi:hypothetical protein ACFQU1_20415 [Chelatococcus sp. GCM10030263]|uniref:hypothetical protein n=1 Tax=Chelatococcus sp. GCM10030263 TaxID=3273387 RepID=UPI0036062654
MKRTMIANRAMTYGTRRLKAKDEFAASARDARLLNAIGRAHFADQDQAAQQRAREEELHELRAQYQDVIGKKPYHGWDAETLREKIAEAKG